VGEVQAGLVALDDEQLVCAAFMQAGGMLALRVECVRRDHGAGTGTATAQCPADHPYAISGGGSGDARHAIGGGMLSSEPVFSDSIMEPVAWAVVGVSQSSPVEAIAECVK
jgi:hypothetical protein